MKKHSIIVLTLLAGCFTNSFAQKGEKTLTVEVSNEWNQNKTDEPIVIDLNNLKAGFNIKSATVWEGNKEIPSQLDDLNGDARADELAFLIDMPAKSNKSFRIILSSEKSEKNYPARTYAQMKAYGHNNKFANITGFSAAGTENVYSFVYHHGPAIESELVAYRIYFNEKQTVHRRHHRRRSRGTGRRRSGNHTRTHANPSMPLPLQRATITPVHAIMTGQHPGRYTDTTLTGFTPLNQHRRKGIAG